MATSQSSATHGAVMKRARTFTFIACFLGGLPPWLREVVSQLRCAFLHVVSDPARACDVRNHSSEPVSFIWHPLIDCEQCAAVHVCQHRSKLEWDSAAQQQSLPLQCFTHLLKGTISCSVSSRLLTSSTTVAEANFLKTLNRLAALIVLYQESRLRCSLYFSASDLAVNYEPLQ